MKNAIIYGFIAGSMVGLILISSVGYLTSWFEQTKERRGRK